MSTNTSSRLQSNPINPLILPLTFSRFDCPSIQNTLLHLQLQCPQTQFPKLLVVLSTILASELSSTVILISHCPKPHYVTIKRRNTTPPSTSPTNHQHIIIHNYNNDRIFIEHPSLSIHILSDSISIQNHSNQPTTTRLINLNHHYLNIRNSSYYSSTRSIHQWWTQNEIMSISPPYAVGTRFINNYIPTIKPLNLHNQPQQLLIRSLNGTSWATSITNTGLTRLQLLKRHLITQLNTPNQVDIFCLQETLIYKSTITNHNYPPFENHYEQFAIYKNHRAQLPRGCRARRGQIVLIKKALKPQLLRQYVDYKHGSFLPVQFTHQSTTFIAASVYINPHREVKQKHINRVIARINQLICDFPHDEIIVIGDFNIKGRDIRKMITSKLNTSPLQLTSHNDKEMITFVRSDSATAIDHAITITQQNLQYHFSTHKDDMPFITSEHHTLQLSLFPQQQRQPLPNHNASHFFNNNNQLPQFQQMCQLMDQHNNLLKWISRQPNQRLLMENSYIINSDTNWPILNQLIITTMNDINNNSIPPHLIESKVNEMCFFFYQVLLTILSKAQSQLEPPIVRPKKSLSQIVAHRSTKALNHHTKWKWYWHRFLNKPFKLKGISKSTTKRIIQFNVKHYMSIALYHWFKAENDFLSNQVAKYRYLSTIRHNFESERCIELIANHFAHLKINQNKNAIIRTINPNTGTLSTSDIESANNFTTTQQNYETNKTQQANNAQSSANSTLDNATRFERQTISDIKSVLFNNPIVLTNNFNVVNDTVTVEEIEKQLINTQSFTSSGPDSVPTVMLKLSLHTNTHTNPHRFPGKFDPAKILAEKDLSDIDINERDFKTRVGEYNQHFVTNHPPTPMLSTIQQLLNMVFVTGYTPQTWQVTEITNIPKTDPPTENCGDFRPISLSATLQKLLNSVLNARLSTIISSITSNNQTGYKSNRDRSEPIIGLFDYLNSPTPIINNNNNNHITSYKTDLTKYTAFIDLAKAFNSIPHDKLLKVLQHKLQQQDSTFCNYIKYMYDHLFYYNNVNSSPSTMQKQSFGIKQGCTISSTLFIIYFDLIVNGVSKLMSKSPLKYFIAAYADDLVISCDSKSELRKYMKLIVKLLRLTQLDINSIKTEILITNPNSQIQHRTTLPVTISNTETIRFKVTDTVTYLGFKFHKNLTFASTCQDLNVKAITCKFNRLMYDHHIPIHVKKLILQRYVTAKLLSNAPVIGVFMSLDKANKTLFKKIISKPFTEMLVSSFHLPNVSKSTNPTNIYENINTMTPHHFALQQAFATIQKLIIFRETTIDHIKNRLNSPTQSSPITTTIEKLVIKMKQLKMPFVEKQDFISDDTKSYYLQDRWYYDAIDTLPTAVLDFLSTPPYTTDPTSIFANLHQIIIVNKVKHPRPNGRQSAMVTLTNTIPAINNPNNQYPSKTLELFKQADSQQHDAPIRCRSMSIFHNTNIHIPPKLIKSGKRDWMNLLSHSLTLSKYSQHLPTVFATNSMTVEPIYYNDYTKMSKFQSTAALFYINRTALSSNLVLKLEMYYPNYNWMFIHNIRLCKWTGATFYNKTKQQHKCQCGQDISYNHILLCKELRSHRQLAINNTWDVLRMNNVAAQIEATIVNLPTYRNEINNMVNQLVNRPRIRDNPHHINAIRSKSITTLTTYYNHNQFYIQGSKINESLSINPTYYLFHVKWRNSLKYLYRFITDPPWIDAEDRITVRLLFKFVTYLHRFPLFTTYKKLPKTTTIETFIKTLDEQNNLHFFHSPPYCPSISNYGTVLILFLAELINLISDQLMPWKFAY